MWFCVAAIRNRDVRFSALRMVASHLWKVNWIADANFGLI
jgi:hypothetical protein